MDRNAKSGEKFRLTRGQNTRKQRSFCVAACLLEADRHRPLVPAGRYAISAHFHPSCWSPAGAMIYSYRRARMGSTRVARRAGKKDAAKATPSNRMVTPIKVRGSEALIP